MSQTANGANLYLGRGRVFFDRYANGRPTGFRFLGEVTKFEITAAVTKKEHYTSTKATNDKIASVPTQQNHSLAIDFMEFTKDNIALALLGDTAAVTQTMTTVTNEVIAGGTGQAPPAIGRTYATAMKNISATNFSAYALDGTTATALTLGTDYSIEDAGDGLITLLSAQAAAGITIKGGYTAGAVTGSKVTGGTTALITGAFKFIGDPTSGEQMNASVWKTEVEPSGALALLGDDYASASLSAEILDDSANHPTSPLYDVVYPKNA